MSNALDDRLSQLDIALPPTLIPRVLTAAQHPRPRRTRRPLGLTLALAALLLVAAFAGSLYAAPRFADALADAPVIGGPTAALLRSMGLGPLANGFTPVNDVAVSSGYRVQLTAAYADATQTILLLHSTPNADVFANFPQPSLTDQFGRQVQYRGGAYDSRNGAEIMEFEPLPWPDGFLGARLTLSMKALQPDAASQTLVRGSWTLHATVALEPSVNVRPLPSDGTIGTTSFHFTSIVRSGPSLEVDLTVRGPLASHLTDSAGAEIPGVSKPHPVFSIDLFEPSGSPVQGLGGDASSGLGSEEVHSRWLIPGPGRYHLVVIYEGVGHFVREINVR